MTRNARSDALHEAVQRFAMGQQGPTFAELALRIADFQYEYSPGFKRLVDVQNLKLRSWQDIPGVPCDAYRVARVAVHPHAEDCLRFATSGTTGSGHGIHALRRADTYRALALAFGRRALLTSARPARVVALAPAPSDPPTSSLGQMMAWFMADFAAREPTEANRVGPDVLQPFLIDERGVNVGGLKQAGLAARAAGEPLLVLATSFALVSLLDELAGLCLAMPEQTVVMQTGGFKGKSREVAPEELRRSVATAFGISERRVVSEYGMTELTSQLYEATLEGSALHAEHRGAPGVYYEPAWLRVVPVDPLSLQPVSEGELGIARIVDLGNVDSAIAIQTQDQVRRVAGGVELLGRAPGAPPRGCSLSVEAFLAALAR